MRRRKSQSPSSSSDSTSSKLNTRTFFGTKHKRRVFRKRDSAATETSSQSSSSVQADIAPWRVENIRQNPPTPDEWWEDIDTPGTIDVYQEVEDDNLLPKVAINARVSSTKFHNCGFETWTHTRAAWRIQTVETIPKKPALIERTQLVKGLRKATSQRTYELPRRMALSDLIRVYNDIWDGDDH
eukprot:CAMPEP_0170769724 /NCGR_PEP_ID=MMETSP0733-20121128/7129_1 /TAXON_ID=186038 /ORGANISM="Fragilariopsis kerguelensis, Strain L26-C5" /LENGTH=183 /DNA_ID=CAMNT_0011111337 /DNA_START=101 /DNA_END=652 /DNA_ORIENTATION=-